ncbi:MAG: protein kinase [Acidobacteriota bacterium]|nr:protein kinase [Acidobacteriota bacterium]
MNPDRWRQIDELFDAVLDIPDESEREKFLSERCGGDEELRREIISLLDAGKESEKNFLQKSAMNIAARNLAQDSAIQFDTHLLNQTIGTYKIEKMLGAGGMGEVYLAYDAKLRRNVALKILPSEYSSSDERVRRFEMEARAVSALNHPNIVTIYDVGSLDGVNFIATECVEGKTLRDVIGGGHLKLKEILAIVIQACDALAAAHSAGIVHRDIKPENIMVRPDGYVKILDFGLAKLSEIDLQTLRDFTQTAKGVIIGTPAYMSPEQVSDENVDHRTDLWSIGVVLYELLTGVNPFKKENRQATFQAILSIEPPLASSLNPEVSAELDRILMKALEKDADLSYQTASDLRADLKRVKREIDSSPSWSLTRSAASGTRRHADAQTRRSYPAYILGGLVLAAIVGLGVWFFVKNYAKSQSKEASEWANARHAQITDSPWVEGYPSLSPDGKNIIFASDVSGDRNIYLQRVGGKNPVNLTPDSKESDTMPAFSADGKYIAFRSERNPSGIYVMEETGENARRISDVGFHPSWSPDAKKIVVSDKAAAIHTVHTVPNSALWVIDAGSGDKRQIETGGDAIMPNWSPNGHRIAFWFVADGKLGEIATVPADGGEPVVVASSDAASDWNPVWSPDGKYLYFASDRSGNMSFWRVAIDEETGAAQGAPESVPTPSKYCRHITFSRDGRTLGYVRYESQSNLQSIAFDPKTLKTTGEASWITRGDKEIGNPDLSPDGETFVARQPTRTQEDLVIFDKNGGNWRSLMSDKFRERIPRWSPDGSQIAFFSDRSGKYQIWTINPDGSNLRQITFTEKTGASAPVYSPDGARMAFTEIEGNAQSSLILDLTKAWNEQPPQPLPPVAGNKSFSVRDWSADGKKLLLVYFEADGDERGIGVFNLETGVHEKMTESGTSPFWLNDNRHFIYTDRNAIFLCDTLTRKVTELYKPFAYELQQANISPDNKMIFFRYLQVDANVWLIDAAPPLQQQNQ